jgi:hypothetical protein
MNSGLKISLNDIVFEAMESFRLYLRWFPQLLLVVLPFLTYEVILVSLEQITTPGEVGKTLTLVFMSLLQPLLLLPVYVLAKQDLKKQKPDAIMAIGVAFSRISFALNVWWRICLRVIPRLLLLVVPGIMEALKYVFCLPMTVDDRYLAEKDAETIIHQSDQLTAGNRWSYFLILMAAFLFTIVVDMSGRYLYTADGLSVRHLFIRVSADVIIESILAVMFFRIMWRIQHKWSNDETISGADVQVGVASVPDQTTE